MRRFSEKSAAYVGRKFINLQCDFVRNFGGGGTLKAPEQSLLNLYNPQLSVKSGYTLAEIVVVMLIIAVIVGVSIKITKSRLDNIISYTYYSTYVTLRTIASGMLADFNPEDELYQSKNNLFLFPCAYAGNTPEECGFPSGTPWPPECETGKEWSALDCKCAAIQSSLPKKGENFCELFERLVNISPSDSTCNGSSIDTNTTEFADLTPDLVLRNGVRLFNVHNNPALIPQLRVSGNDDETAEKDLNQKGYIIYADIDGSRGDSVLWEDVYPFYLTLGGRVIPAYDANANPDGAGGDSEHHLQVSVKNETFSNDGHRILKWLSKSVSFKEGACQSGYVKSSTPYCTGVSSEADCIAVNSGCQLKTIRPLKFF